MSDVETIKKHSISNSTPQLPVGNVLSSTVERQGKAGAREERQDIKVIGYGPRRAKKKIRKPLMMSSKTKAQC